MWINNPFANTIPPAVSDGLIVLVDSFFQSSHETELLSVVNMSVQRLPAWGVSAIHISSYE